MPKPNRFTIALDNAMPVLTKLEGYADLCALEAELVEAIAHIAVKRTAITAEKQRRRKPAVQDAAKVVQIRGR